MRKDRRFETPQPTEPGFYYARLKGTDDIRPVDVELKFGNLVVWEIGDECERYLNDFEWFGHLRLVEEKKR